MDKAKRESLTTFIVCLAVGAFIFLETMHYPEVRGGQGFGQGPAFYPRLLAFFIMLLGVLDLRQGFKKHSASAPLKAEPGRQAGPGYSSVVLVVLFAAVLIFSLEYLGFFVAGFFLTFFTGLVIRRKIHCKSLLLDVFFSMAIMVVIYLVFEVFVGIELPGSVWLD